jgi:hypothetical protein
VIGHNYTNSVDINPNGRAPQGDGTTIRFCNISGSENGIWLEGQNCLIENNYIHNLFSNTGSSDPHIDGIQLPGTNIGAVPVRDAVVRHNNIDLDVRTATSCLISLDPENLTIDNNRLSGGAYCIYYGGNASGALTNNVFNKFAYGRVDLSAQAKVTVNGNTDERTGAVVTR